MKRVDSSFQCCINYYFSGESTEITFEIEDVSEEYAKAESAARNEFKTQQNFLEKSRFKLTGGTPAAREYRNGFGQKYTSYTPQGLGNQAGESMIFDALTLGGVK